MTGEEFTVPAAAASHPIWLRVGTLIDGVGTAPLRDAHLVYDAGAILHAGTGEPLPAFLRPGQSRPDALLPGCTALPGLIDAHAHLFLEGGELDPARRSAALRLSPETLLRQAQNRMERLVRLGIIAVRDAGDKAGVGLALSALSATGRHPLMPYVDSPGAAIHHRGGYGGFMAEPIEEYPSVEACIEARIRAGAHRIKLIATDVVDFRRGAVVQPPQMTAEEVAACAEAARQAGRQTMVHASGEEGIGRAVAARVDSVEHGYFVSDDQLARMAEQTIAWVPTFAPVEAQRVHAGRLGWDAATVSTLRSILERHATSLARAHRLGVPVIAGSDAGSAGVAHGLGLFDELMLMEEAGLPSLAVLAAATGKSSARLGFREQFGQLTAGYRSRFLFTRHSPLKTVANIRKPKLIVYDGAPFWSAGDVPASGL